MILIETKEEEVV